MTDLINDTSAGCVFYSEPFQSLLLLLLLSQINTLMGVAAFIPTKKQPKRRRCTFFLQLQKTDSKKTDSKENEALRMPHEN